MKKFIVLLGVVSLLVSCSNSAKYEKSIKDYLSKSLNDAKSYESVEFSSLDSTFSIYFDTDEGRKLWNDKFDQESAIGTLEIKIKYEDNTETKALLEDSLTILKQDFAENEMLYNEREKNFVREHVGYRIYHTFRAKNKLGALTLAKWSFQLDKDYNVIDAKEVEK